MKKKIADKIIANYNSQTQKYLLDAKRLIFELEELKEVVTLSEMSEIELQFEHISKKKDRMPNNFTSFIVPDEMSENEKYQYQLECLSTSFESCKLFSQVDNWRFKITEKLDNTIKSEFSCYNSLETLNSQTDNKIKEEQNKYLKRKNSFHKTGLKLGIPFLCIAFICILVIIFSNNFSYSGLLYDIDYDFLKIYAIVNLVISLGAVISASILFGFSLRKDEITEEELSKTFEEIASSTIKRIEEQYGEKFRQSKNNAISSLTKAKEKVEPLYEKIKFFTDNYVFSFIDREHFDDEVLPAYQVLKSGEATNYTDALTKAKDYQRKDEEFEKMLAIEKEKLAIERIKADNQIVTNDALLKSARNVELAQEKAATAAAANAALNAERLRVEKKLAKDEMKTNKKIRDNL